MTKTTFNVELPEDIAEMVSRHVDDGSYGSVSDVVVEGLRLLDERERDHAERLAAIRRRLDAAASDPVRISSDDLKRHFDRLALEAETKRSA